MPRKKSARMKAKKKISKSKSISKVQNSFEKQINDDFKEVEKWVVERKKFFKKFAWVVLLILVLLIISYFMTS